MIWKQHIRPEAEWIIVLVPAIVSPAVWQQAQDALKRNIKASRRNAKQPFLLQGFLKCAKCGLSFASSSGRDGSKDSRRYYYGCQSRHFQPVIRERLSCYSPFIRREEIDPIVWAAVCKVITEPNLIIQYLEEQAKTVINGGLTDQLAYVEREIKKCEREENQWDRAFADEIFSLSEYKDKKTSVMTRKQVLAEECARLLAELQDAQEFIAQREVVRQHLLSIQENGFAENLPLEDKRRILALLVDHVVINTKEGWFSLEGVIKGTYYFGNPALTDPHPEKAQFTWMSSLLHLQKQLDSWSRPPDQGRQNLLVWQ